MQPLLSIIIPTYNTRELLEKCLTSLYEIETKHDFEVIVVDNGTDDSSEMVRRKFNKVTVIKSDNRGFAHSVNVGWKKAKSDLVLFLNSDTVIKRKFIKKVTRYMKEYPNVGVLSLKLTLRSGKIDPDTHRGLVTPWAALTFFFGFEKVFPTSRLFGQYHKGFLGFTTIHEIDAGAGASMLMSKDLLEELHGWDESYTFYGEDLDICYRTQKAGYKVIFFPHVDIEHLKGATSGLKRESKDVARRVDAEEQIKLVRSTIWAWERFFKKFYTGKYPKPFLWFVLFGINLKGWLRIILFRLGFRI